MKRKDFMKIIKLRSYWKIDKRMGNYKLPNGERLSSYIMELVKSQMQLDKLAIRENGNLCHYFGGERNAETKKINDFILMPDFAKSEECTFEEMEKRIEKLVFEIIE